MVGFYFRVCRVCKGKFLSLIWYFEDKEEISNFGNLVLYLGMLVL